MVVYARVILGYYMYVSAIALVTIPLDEVLGGDVNLNHYAAQPILYPTLRHDMWGTEDPRVYEVDGELLMTYTGRSVNYFNPVIRRERTLPITAIRVRSHRVWDKRIVHVLPRGLREHVISDKDAFIARLGTKLFLFHRPHMDDENHYLTISELPENVLAERSLREIEPAGTWWIAPHASYEYKIGWNIPVAKPRENELIALLHGVDRELQIYRVFAMHISYSSSEGIVVRAVTPTYIMEPTQIYEIIGDRPYVVFPCGAWLIDKSTILISYGAADQVIGFGLIDLNELLSELDRGRIY